MSPPRHDAPPQAWRSPGSAVPGSGAVHHVRVPSGTRRAQEHNAKDLAVSGKAGEDCRGIDRVAEHACISLRLQEPHSLWWQAAMRLREGAAAVLAGYAEVILATSGA